MVEVGKLVLARIDVAQDPEVWPFSANQMKILAALEGKVMGDVELALALDPDDDAVGCQSEEDLSPTKLRTLYRELSLLTDMRLIAHDRTLGGYYRPDRPPASLVAPFV
jgi:hypothetical protein